MTDRRELVGPTSSSPSLLGELLLRLTELTVVIGGGILLVTTQTLDVAGIAGLVMLSATWAVLGSVLSALQPEEPPGSTRNTRRRPPERRRVTPGLSPVARLSARGRLSLAPLSGKLSLPPGRDGRLSVSTPPDRSASAG